MSRKYFPPFKIHKDSQGISRLQNPLIIALDTDDPDRIKELISVLGPHVGGFKLGPRLILRQGPAFMEEIALRFPVFLDCKFFDIQSTVISSIRAGFHRGASMVTVHALNSIETLKALSDLEVELNTFRPFRILCVTVLTDWAESSLPSSVWKDFSLEEHVQRLAERAWNSGLHSLVCSPKELKPLWALANAKKINPFFINPGIRWGKNAGKDEQKRVVSPKEALAWGAGALVLGRPVLENADPLSVVEEIHAQRKSI